MYSYILIHIFNTPAQLLTQIFRLYTEKASPGARCVESIVSTMEKKKEMTNNVDLTYYKLITSQLSYGTQILYDRIPIYVVMYDCHLSKT